MTTISPEVQAAVTYITQLAQDFLATLPPSARGPVHAHAQAALATIEQALLAATGATATPPVE